ncbi:MAG: helix-turn-helix domain-containing protein, partial [Desulfamplus sp.]|nr:helix-turn-helix domain-containing protein [Desulfamplus sp.]
MNLTNEEREELELLITKRSSKSIEVKRAYILLAADEAGDKRWQDEQIHNAYNVSVRSVERVRERFVEEGFRIAVYGKTREVFKVSMDNRIDPFSDIKSDPL